ncbi:MAG: carboxypeptidase regulatory-like domain-containing protein [Muribaculaceae bacterium]|nr:carboxypeptidase regulatory-like domain-containing protein [Muribaculaceae bacterium]
MKQFKKAAAAFALAAALLTSTTDVSAAEDTQAYGMLAFTADQYSLTNHLVTFPLYGDGNAVYTSAIPFYQTSTAGAYTDDGAYYVAASRVSGSKEVPDALVRMDISAGTYATVGSITGFDNFVNDMTYDHAGSTMYAVAKVNDAYSALYTIDLGSGKGTKVADLDRKFFTLAADWSGRLYAISFSGDLCRIDKTDGTVTVVGHTGCAPAKFQSMEFDHGTKTLWWAATATRLSETGMVEMEETFMATVDVTTGVATRGRALGDDQVVGLYIPYVVVPDGAPNAVQNLTVTPAPEGQYAATLKWTNPTHTFGGEPVKAFAKVEILRDGVAVGTASAAQPGAESEYTDVAGSSGGAAHTWTVVAHTAAGAGVPASVSVFVGTDIPAAAEGINVERLGTNSARISWKPVTLGANGGWIDTGSLTYSVKRLPDNTLVAESLTETEWTETGVETSGNYSYEITATNATGSSAPAVSPSITLGPNLGFPYYDEFSEEDFAKWTTVDANDDGNGWQYFAISWAKAAGAYFMAANNDGDDWLISPAFDFEAGATYKITMSCMANGSHSVEMLLLKDYDHIQPVSNLGTLVFERTWALGSKEFVFSTGEHGGTLNLAMHQTTASGNSYLIIDNIQIEKLVEHNLAATEITGNPTPVTGNTYPYAVAVTNRGTLDRTGFSVELLDAAGKRVAVKEVTETLAAGASTLVYVECTVTDGLTSLQGHIVDPLDEIASDDHTPAISITVMPVGTPEEVTVGAKKGMSSYSPFYFSSKYSVNQQVYSGNEIGITRGRITAVKYAYKTSSYSAAPTNAAIKVYLCNTDRTKAAGGWIPLEELTLVYEGAVDMVRGEGVLDLELTKSFDYEGGNLAVVTMHSLENATQSYYSGVQFPYYDSPLAGNVPLYYQSSSPFTYGEVAGSESTYYGNSVVTFMVQTGGAMLGGVVTDSDSNPVEGATVELEQIHASALTDASGAYRFDFVPNGDYTVSVSKLGYESVTKTEIAVNDADVEVNVAIKRLPEYNVAGVAVDAFGEPVAGAAVALEGYVPLQTVADAAGRFEFAAVVGKPSSVTVTKDWHAPATVAFELNADTDLGTIALGYAHYPAGNVTATAGDDNTLTVSWTAPDARHTARLDSGEPASQTGITNNVGTAILGTAFRKPMVVDRLLWQTTSQGGPHKTVNVYVYELDEQGQPTGTLLYSARNVPNTDGEWSAHELPSAIEAPRGCLVAVNYPGFLGLAIDSGEGSCPFASGTYYYSIDFASGEFAPCEALGISGNLFIRAEGYAFPAENEPAAAVGSEREALPEWYAYKVWRGAGYNPSEWTLVSDSPVSGTEIADAAWASLAPGVYSYAVAPVYPDGTVSAPEQSCYLLKNVYSTLAIAAMTNSHSADASGAKAILSNADGSRTYSAELDADGRATIEGVWKDNYTLTLSLPGYETLSAAIDITKDDNVSTGTLVMSEIIAEPVNLKIYPAGEASGDVLLTWNESGEVTDDFESYEPFAVPGSSEMPWTCIDGDGARTFAELDYDFPGRTKPMSFIVFDPKKTTPSMFSDRPASHAYSGEQNLACFSSVYGNDDYLISPRLTYHTDFKFGFMARGYSQTYVETIMVGYSETTGEPSSFVWLGDEISVPMQQWKHYEFDIPAKARYVALRSTSSDGFTLFVDDVTISSGNGFDMNVAITGPEVKYEVSLDGTPVATVNVASCVLPGAADGVHTATVKAVYASGSSSEASITFGTDGISDVQADGGVAVWPNPAVGFTNVRGEFDSAVLYDLSGRAVARFGNESSQLDLSRVLPGLYVLEVRSASVRHTFKLVVK